MLIDKSNSKVGVSVVLGTNPSRIRPTKRNRCNSLQKHQVKVRSPDGDTEYFDIVAGVLQGDKLAPYLFTICLD